MTSKQAFSAPRQLQYKTKHSALCIQQQIPTPKLPIAEGNQGEEKLLLFSPCFSYCKVLFYLFELRRETCTREAVLC